MAEIVSTLSKFWELLVSDLQLLQWKLKPRLNEEEFEEEYGASKDEFAAEHGIGALKTAELAPEERERYVSAARKQQEEDWEEEVANREAAEAERQRQLQEESLYRQRGDRTQAEYDEYMEKQQAEYYATKEHIKTYRGVDIYRNPNGSYMASVNNKGISCTDLNTMEYLIDSELDSGSATAEIQQGSVALHNKSEARREGLTREDEISSKPTPDIAPAPLIRAAPPPEPVETQVIYRDRTVRRYEPDGRAPAPAPEPYTPPPTKALPLVEPEPVPKSTAYSSHQARRTTMR